MESKTILLVEDNADDEALTFRALMKDNIGSQLVVARDGDFYGPVVNLASRLSEIASGGVIYASEALHDELAGTASFEWATLGTRHLRSIGPVSVFALIGESGTAP